MRLKNLVRIGGGIALSAGISGCYLTEKKAEQIRGENPKYVEYDCIRKSRIDLAWDTGEGKNYLELIDAYHTNQGGFADRYNALTATLDELEDHPQVIGAQREQGKVTKMGIWSLGSCGAGALVFGGSLRLSRRRKSESSTSIRD